MRKRLKICIECEKPFTANGIEREEGEYCSLRCLHREVSVVIADGGTVGANGKCSATTWAYVFVDKNENIIKQESGWTTDFITSPQAEINAIITALENLPEGWSGELRSDCLYAINCLFYGWSQKKVDPQLKERWNKLKLGRITTVHLSGHPTKRELETGISKTGRPVCRFNKLADELCTEQASVCKSK